MGKKSKRKAKHTQTNAAAAPATEQKQVSANGALKPDYLRDFTIAINDVVGLEESKKARMIAAITDMLQKYPEPRANNIKQLRKIKFINAAGKKEKLAPDEIIYLDNILRQIKQGNRIVANKVNLTTKALTSPVAATLPAAESKQELITASNLLAMPADAQLARLPEYVLDITRLIRGESSIPPVKTLAEMRIYHKRMENIQQSTWKTALHHSPEANDIILQINDYNKKAAAYKDSMDRILNERSNEVNINIKKSQAENKGHEAICNIRIEAEERYDKEKESFENPEVPDFSNYLHTPMAVNATQKDIEAYQLVEKTTYCFIRCAGVGVHTALNNVHLAVALRLDWIAQGKPVDKERQHEINELLDSADMQLKASLDFLGHLEVTLRNDPVNKTAWQRALLLKVNTIIKAGAYAAEGLQKTAIAQFDDIVLSLTGKKADSMSPDFGKVMRTAQERDTNGNASFPACSLHLNASIAVNKNYRQGYILLHQQMAEFLFDLVEMVKECGHKIKDERLENDPRYVTSMKQLEKMGQQNINIENIRLTILDKKERAYRLVTGEIDIEGVFKVFEVYCGFLPAIDIFPYVSAADSHKFEDGADYAFNDFNNEIGVRPYMRVWGNINAQLVVDAHVMSLQAAMQEATLLAHHVEKAYFYADVDVITKIHNKGVAAAQMLAAKNKDAHNLPKLISSFPAEVPETKHNAAEMSQQQALREQQWLARKAAAATDTQQLELRSQTQQQQQVAEQQQRQLALLGPRQVKSDLPLWPHEQDYLNGVNLLFQKNATALKALNVAFNGSIEVGDYVTASKALSAIADAQSISAIALLGKGDKLWNLEEAYGYIEAELKLRHKAVKTLGNYLNAQRNVPEAEQPIYANILLNMSGILADGYAGTVQFLDQVNQQITRRKAALEARRAEFLRKIDTGEMEHKIPEDVWSAMKPDEKLAAANKKTIEAKQLAYEEQRFGRLMDRAQHGQRTAQQLTIQPSTAPLPVTPMTIEVIEEPEQAHWQVPPYVAKAADDSKLPQRVTDGYLQQILRNKFPEKHPVAEQKEPLTSAQQIQANKVASEAIIGLLRKNKELSNNKNITTVANSYGCLSFELTEDKLADRFFVKSLVYSLAGNGVAELIDKKAANMESELKNPYGNDLKSYIKKPTPNSVTIINPVDVLAAIKGHKQQKGPVLR